MIRLVAPGLRGDENATNIGLPHILLVLDQIAVTLGGGERVALRLAALLPKYGYRVSILTFSVNMESSALKMSPCPVYVLPLSKTYDLRALRAAFQMRGFLERQQIRIVQTFFESSDLWAGAVTKMMSKAKLIWSRRDMGILRSGKHAVAYRLLSDVPDAVFAVSEQVRRHCIEVDGIDPERVLTIYNGLDLAAWKSVPKADKASGRFVISTVGNVRRVKGHDVLIRAAAVVVAHSPEVSFRIAGEVLEPDYFAELQALVRELNLVDHVHFMGGVTDLREFLSSADIFVLPSRSEGFSNAIVEAMALSLPVVATNVGGNAEAVEDGVSGFVVPSEDPAAMAVVIARLLEDPVRAKAMGEAGKALVAEKFTIEAMMDQVTGAYARVLARAAV
jgi:L-malate glycosyltransferase